jgi:hypothetical protein
VPTLLERCAQALEAERFPVALIAAGPATPVDQLSVELEADAQGRVPRIFLGVIPGLEDELDPGISLLQCWTELPFVAEAPHMVAVVDLLLVLNRSVPLPGFSLNATDGSLFHRHVLILGPDEDANLKVVVEAALMLGFLVSRFAGAIEAVATGRQTADQAASQLLQRGG